MLFSRVFRRLTAALVAVMLVPALARGGELEVSPILVELDTHHRTALLSVRNGSQERVRYQVRPFAWGQDLHGKMQLDPTRDLVVFPPLFELGPGEQRNIRIGSSTVAEQRERSYRVFVEEMPPAETPGTGAQVRVLTRVGIPAFFAPTQAQARGEAVILAAGGGRLSFTLRNTGTIRLRPTAVEVTGVGAGNEQTFTKRLEPWYVLAGGERFYELELPPDACARTREVRATVAVEPAPFVATVQLPGGACER